MKNTYRFFVSSLFLVIFSSFLFFSCISLDKAKTKVDIDGKSIIDRNCGLETQIIKFIRKAGEDYFNNKPQSVQIPEELKIEGRWVVSIGLYHKGRLMGYGDANSEVLSSCLTKATFLAVNSKKMQGLDKNKFRNTRFLFNLKDVEGVSYSFIEYQGQAKELVKNLVAVYDLDKDLIQEKIKQAEEYLIRVIDKEKYGVYKYYYAVKDSFEDKLHTIYTADTIYSFLKLYDFYKHRKLLKYIDRCADFVLSMQNKEKGTKGYGAFHYSYDLNIDEPDRKFVVGTTAKTIMALLELYKRTGEETYIKSSKLGADWLISMQKPNGRMQSYKRYRDGSWYNSTKYSLLYNGQVLSALSRIYKFTQDKKYYKSAKKIARNFVSKVEREGYYLEDEYRKANPISTSWVIMSLLDFYKVNGDKKYKDIVLKCSRNLLKRQIEDRDDIRRYGRWRRAYSTSGNGWLAEVMVEVYEFCRDFNQKGCDEYKESIVKVIRWLVQNTYSEENSFFLPNPDMAIGGAFWNFKNRYIRTDSVFHAVNAYIGIIDSLEDEILTFLPKRTFEFENNN